jgi:hypothetical protein
MRDTRRAIIVIAFAMVPTVMLAQGHGCYSVTM